ncbi:MAG TPA: hypothetical protein VFN32_14390 [Rhodococcus sp. (in: high G+C Gram-positive bacteria)]|jgi:hypothetical protein|nr:hypothetical protein [Rhodococcus sp. (in: high G+C Gram-positive bacteria)]
MTWLQVDIDALRALASALTSEAELIGELEPGAPLAAAATTMTSSAVGGALTRAEAPLHTAYHAMSICLHRMAEATSAGARNYETAEDEFRRQVEAVGSSFERTGVSESTVS